MGRGGRRGVHLVRQEEDRRGGKRGMEESKGLFDSSAEGVKPGTIGIDESQFTISVPDVPACHTATLKFVKSTLLFVVSRPWAIVQTITMTVPEKNFRVVMEEVRQRRLADVALRPGAGRR